MLWDRYPTLLYRAGTFVCFFLHDLALGGAREGVSLRLSTAEPTVRGTPPALGAKTVSLKTAPIPIPDGIPSKSSVRKQTAVLAGIFFVLSPSLECVCVCVLSPKFWLFLIFDRARSWPLRHIVFARVRDQKTFKKSNFGIHMYFEVLI